VDGQADGAVAAVGGLLALGEPVELRAIGAFALIAAGLVLVTRPEVTRRVANRVARFRGQAPP